VNPPTLGPCPDNVATICTLAAANPTPFYVYDAGIMPARVGALRAALPEGSRLLYSVKANPHPAVMRAAASAGCGLEIASPGELDGLIEAGLDPGNAVLVGPGKSDALLESALAAGVGLVVVEGRRELARLEKAAASAGGEAVRVALRLSLPGARGSLRMSGHQFGMERAEVCACHSALRSSRQLTFTGYHGYLASQLTDPDDIVHNARLVLSEAAELTRIAGRCPQLVDLGGGFGIPYLSSEPPLDLAGLTSGLRRLPGQLGGSPFDMLFESGRFLAGPLGALVCRVMETKTIMGRRYVILDGGMNSSGLLGLANALRPPAHSVVRHGRIVTGGPDSNLCGPLCTPLDRLATAVPCDADADDLVIWWNMGAYGVTMAPTEFLSFPRPGEIVIRSGAVGAALRA
jgi:diaminopimelate decarboxylase